MTKRTVPAHALMFDSQCTFAAPETGEDGITRAPVKLTASSGKPFSHPYWGTLVFDYSGMKTAKDTVPLDWCHSREVIGYGKVTKNDKRLDIEGELISTQPGDRAEDIMKKGAAGVPWESSISFDPWNGLAIEVYEPGTKAEVNGKKYDGPIIVFRQSLLRGVAICPHGADPNTHSRFDADTPAQHDVPVTVFTQGADMSLNQQNAHMEMEDVQPGTELQQEAANQPEGANASDDANAEAPATPDARSELMSRLADYTTRFGVENGTAWFTADKDLVDCYAEFVEQLATAHSAQLAEAEGKTTAAVAKVDELQARLTQLGEFAQGEPPVSGNPAPKADATEFEQRADVYERQGCDLGVARFAAGLRLNRTKK